MKAMIFAAGLGTRLKPLTDDRPKALVPLCGKPLIWHTINQLKHFGISEIVVNVHHHAKLLSDYLLSQNWDIPIHISDESSLLLDTGGGLLNAQHFLAGNEPFLVINVDIIFSFNLNLLFEYHSLHKPLATLVVRNRVTDRQFLFDDNMLLSGWKNFKTGEEKIVNSNFSNSRPLAFSGIHIIDPAIFDLIHLKGKFSIVELYLQLAKNNPILAFEDHSDFWLDLGKPGQIALAEEYLSKKSENSDPVL